jgi:CO dehydrogenase maturation factor
VKIAVSGKGGAGKTTISATIARLFAQRGYSVLAIDGDPNPNLGVALGVEAQGLAELAPLPRSIIEQRTDEAGATQTTLTQPIESITTEHGIVGPDGVTLLLSTSIDHAGAG